MIEQIAQIYGYLHGMWRYRWQALIIAWVIAALGWMFVLSLPDNFSAKAVVYIDTTSIMKPLLKGLAPETDSNDELKIMSRMLLSRENLLTVMRETDMDLEASTPAQREAMVQRLAASIELKGGNAGKKKNRDKSNVYEISYSGASPQLVFQVVSNILNTMIEGTLSSTRTDTVTAQKFLDTQIAEYEQRLSIAEQELAAFKKSNVGFMPDEKGSYYSRLQRAQDSVEKTAADLRLAEQRYTELNRQLRGENPILGTSGLTSPAAAKIIKLEAELKQLLNRFTPQHPDVLALQAIIEDERSLLEAGVGTEITMDDPASVNPVYQQFKVEVSKAKVEVETLKIQLEQQKQSVVKLRESIDVIPEVEARLSKLNRDYTVTRERYLDLVERRESARLAQDAGQSSSEVTFRVIDPPIVPLAPSGPNRELMVAMVFVLSLAAGFAWAFLRYLLYPTYFDLRQVSNRLGLPVLGSVSLYMSEEHRLERKKQLMTFLTASAMLFVFTVLMFMFNDTGARLVSKIVS